MRVLTITGDRTFRAGHPRFDLQAGAVERLEALYWGPGALWPHTMLDVRHQAYEVVSAQDPFWRGLLGLIFARRFKARFNVQVHADLKAQGFLKQLLARFVLLRADSIRVVSEKINSQVLEFGARAPVIVLPIFVDVERFKTIDRKPDTQPTILWVGRLENEKDPLHALEVFREVLEKVSEAKMIMLGSGSLLEKVKREAEDKKLPVEFPGWQDTTPYLARAHVVLSTSKAESWGASIVEALAVGVPVVAPDVGIAREAGAIIVPREGLADTVARVLRAPGRAALNLPLLTRSEWVVAWKSSLDY